MEVRFKRQIAPLLAVVLHCDKSKELKGSNGIATYQGKYSHLRGHHLQRFFWKQMVIKTLENHRLHCQQDS